MKHALVLLAACAPITSRTRTTDTVISRESLSEPSGDPNIVASIQPMPDSFMVSARREQRCRTSEVEHVRLTNHVRRKADRLVLATEITLATLFGAAGGFLVYDHRADNQDRVLGSDLTPETGRAIGISTASLGGVLLLAGVIDGMRARDRVVDAGTTKRKRPTAAPLVVCDDQPATRVAIVAVTSNLEVPLGTTDGDGKLTVAWDAVPSTLLQVRDNPQARIAARVDDRTWPLGDISLAPARTRLAARARAEAEAAASPERWDELAATFPDEHGAEATRRARELRISRLRETIASNDLPAARIQLEAAARLYKDDGEVAALATELTARESTAHRDRLWKLADEAVALASVPDASVDQFGAASLALVTAEAAGADPRGVELRARLESAKRTRITSLLAAVARAKNDTATARGALADAELLIPADPGVAKARAKVDAAEVTELRARARKLVAAKQYADADPVIARMIELRPTDRALVKERERVAKLAAKQVAVRVTPPAPREPAVQVAATPPAAEPPAPTPGAPTAATTPSAQVAVSVTPPVSAPTASRPSTRARARASYTLRAATPAAPIEWLHAPAACIGTYVGSRVVLQCGDGDLALVRKDLDVTLTCEASTCSVCADLRRNLVTRGKLTMGTDTCEEAAK